MAIRTKLNYGLNEKIDLSNKLLQEIKRNLPELEKLLNDTQGHWQYEDGIYRFYHQSFKVYVLQTTTKKIVKVLQSIMPGLTLNPWFMEIINQGINKKFSEKINKKWLYETRPILEAFLHAKYFLEMVVKYGKELTEPPNLMPSGWASVLYLYNIR